MNKDLGKCGIKEEDTHTKERRYESENIGSEESDGRKNGEQQGCSDKQ